MNVSVEKSRPKEEAPMPPATPLADAPTKCQPEKRPRGGKEKQKAETRKAGIDGKTDLRTLEEHPEF